MEILSMRAFAFIYACGNFFTSQGSSEKFIFYFFQFFFAVQFFCCISRLIGEARQDAAVLLLLGLRSRSNLGRRPKFTFVKGKGTDTQGNNESSCFPILGTSSMRPN